MRSVLTIASCFIVALFVLSVVTPEPYYLPRCQSTAGFLTVVDDDDFALCSHITVVLEARYHTEHLLLLEQAWSIPSPFISKSLCRAPPFCVSFSASC